jgi:hypothetical protein
LFVDLEIELAEGVFECLNMEAEENNKIFNFLNDGSFSKGKHNLKNIILIRCQKI